MATAGKLLEDAAIKVSAVASTLGILSVRDMLEALIAASKTRGDWPTWPVGG